jgi:hypothetical protein
MARIPEQVGIKIRAILSRADFPSESTHNAMQIDTKISDTDGSSGEERDPIYQRRFTSSIQPFSHRKPASKPSTNLKSVSGPSIVPHFLPSNETMCGTVILMPLTLSRYCAGLIGYHLPRPGRRLDVKLVLNIRKMAP